jgi:hypothetical protein
MSVGSTVRLCWDICASTRTQTTGATGHAHIYAHLHAQAHAHNEKTIHCCNPHESMPACCNTLFCIATCCTVLNHRVTHVTTRRMYNARTRARTHHRTEAQTRAHTHTRMHTHTVSAVSCVATCHTSLQRAVLIATHGTERQCAATLQHGNHCLALQGVALRCNVMCCGTTCCVALKHCARS